MTQRLIVAGSVVGVPTADAVLVDGTRIAAIGRATDLRRPGLDEQLHPGAHLGASLRDAHFHPVGYTAALQRLVVKDAVDFDDLHSMLRRAAAEAAPGTTLIGIRMDDEVLAERRLPTRADIDTMVDDRPVILYRYCGHIASTNTAGLEAAGVGPSTPDPSGGVLDRDEQGMPTGVLRETAVNLVSDVLGHRATGLRPESLVEATRHMAALGLSSVGAMVAAGASLWADASSELDVFVRAAPDMAVTMHTLIAATDPDELEAAATRVEQAAGPVRFLGVKMFSDGSLGGHTAAMDDPFSDKPGELGTNRLTMDEALAAGRRSLALGGMVAIHAIGDRACGFVLDVFERLLDEGADPAALRIEHASVLRALDIERIARLGIIASVQPAFLASETAWLEKRLGAARLALTYPFRSLLDAGARLAGGSDCPVEPPHPLHGVASAVDRGGLVPGEALTNLEAWEMFTSGAAAALREPPPLEVGSPADLLVVSGDPLTASPSELRGMDIVATYRGGTPGSQAEGSAWNG
jgi:predicted amidohydrolase YtcJ